MSFVVNIKGRKSKKIISDALTMLENEDYKGPTSCENNTGDGAGILVQIPHEFFFDECNKLGVHLPPFGKYGVGMLFFPKDLRQREECRDIFNRCAEKLGLEILVYRNVPVNNSDIGPTAFSTEPQIEQVFIACPDYIHHHHDFERKLFVLRNYSCHTIESTLGENEAGFHVASLSYKTVVYKGRLTSMQAREYFPDLSNNRFVSAFALVHTRFATNTPPSWKLAQPFRYIVHTGEINTIQGNLNWLRTNEKGFSSPYFTHREMDMLLPIVTQGQSDSACLDNMIELLTLCGRSLPHVMMMLIPEAWDGNDNMDPVKKAFYEFHSSFMEPWDGPASISFTDGTIIGATLDRNGLRPLRYCITFDDQVIMAAETGVLPLDPAMIKEKGRLQPGKMFVVDLEHGRIISDEELKKSICSQKPYAEWLNKNKIRIEELAEPVASLTHLEHKQVVKYQKVFGYTTEDLETIIAPMALDSKEPVGSMGADVPLAVLSQQPQHLSNYFMQLFAQVTNPPLDPMRERLTMSLSTFVGNHGNLLVEDESVSSSVALQHPVLTNYELEKLRSIDRHIFEAKTLQLYFIADEKPGSLQRGLDRLCRYAVDAVEDGFRVLILSNRSIDSYHAPIPSLLATAAVHNHLSRKGMRGKVGLVVECGDVWEVHHFACLLGFGATAVNPYLALSTIRDLKISGKLETALEVDQLKKNYIKAVCDGLLRVFSKMGISTLQSYLGARCFEIIGIKQDVVNKHFTGAVSRIEGMGLDEIARENLTNHYFAFTKKPVSIDRLTAGGVYQWRRKGEHHLFNPQTIHLLQHATRYNDYAVFKRYTKAINDQDEKALTLRGLFKFKQNRPCLPLSEVEPAEQILKRFATGAMSFGSISWEAHTTLAVAMNRLGAMSNSGEGGEDEIRYDRMENGDSMRSAIKQVASARFGVTSLYLTEADELQIKMSQGDKPGEGGHLPGGKVDEWIAKTRKSTPWIELISPPSHQDVHSIQDMTQLIFDLKNANRQARISVKLVSKTGVGNTAYAAAKGKVDVILISGSDGGTGSSPLSSIKHAGLPWELGLAETHQMLVRNKLRSRIILQTDGQLRTGRDIAIATLLGAEEWGVATAAMIVEGCIMMRKCHLNTCPVGVATQDPKLREQFTGQADHVVNFFKFLAEELREIMAELGFRTINEMVGQVELLEPRESISHWKYKKLDLLPIIYKEPASLYTGLYKSEEQNHGLAGVLDWKLLEAAQPALQDQQKVYAEFFIKNTDRTAGTILSNEVSKKYRAQGLPDNTIHFKFTGTAGQSFGAFNTCGLTLELEGDSNDYFGKGLSGARLIIYPSRNALFVPAENVITGNGAFYGATAGEAYIRGKAGDRFCVRNSGAFVVVEGVGDHGCEYMTGGRIVILGEIGRNFAAGMSGGVAYIYDINEQVASLCNPETVNIGPLNEEGSISVHTLISNHFKYTKSTVANFLLNDFENQIRFFKKVYPIPKNNDKKPSANSDKAIQDESINNKERANIALPIKTILREKPFATQRPLASKTTLDDLAIERNAYDKNEEQALSDLNTESEMVKKLEETIEQLKKKNEELEITNESYFNKDNRYFRLLPLPDRIRTSIKQYLIYFNEYVEKTKGIVFNLEVKSYEKGLLLEFPKTEDNDLIEEYFIEYVSLAKSNIQTTKFKIVNDELSVFQRDVTIVELKNEIRKLHSSLEIKSVEIKYLNREIERLTDLFQSKVQHNYIYVNTHAESHSNAENHVKFDFPVSIEDLQKEFLNLKSELIKIAPEVTHEVNKIDDELMEVDNNNEKSLKKSTLSKIKRLYDAINNEDSSLNQAVKASKKCLKTLQDLGKTYNKFAQWLMLPQVPTVFLNEK
ncbi:MAG: glutamate synthase large subunit [Williamsia sp.]|nr:glutamate synthase large subunit [Williamsia sp.]